jgi:hypothetical protein
MQIIDKMESYASGALVHLVAKTASNPINLMRMEKKHGS